MEIRPEDAERIIKEFTDEYFYLCRMIANRITAANEIRGFLHDFRRASCDNFKSQDKFIINNETINVITSEPDK